MDDPLVIPELAGWRKKRCPKQLETNRIEVAPDWACEIPSPSSALRDRTAKKTLYEEHGVKHLWLVDPFHKTLELFRLGANRLFPAGVFGGREKARLEPFQDMEIALGALWLET